MQLFGRNFERPFVVIHAIALVFKEKSLYFAEFRKVISFVVAFLSWFFEHKFC